MIEKGKKISLEYTVFLEDGTQIDTNIGEPPLVFEFGMGQMFPVIEQELIGLTPGDQKKIVLQPEDAYGHVVDEAFREVELSAIPDQFRQVGAVFGIQDPAGGIFPIRVHQINDDKVILDFNHPLAGKSLQFDVKVIAVK